MTWKTSENVNPFSTYGSRVTRVTLVLFDERRKELLRVVLDFGPEEKRLAFRDIAAARLGVAPVVGDDRRWKLFYDDESEPLTSTTSDPPTSGSEP